MTWGEGAQIITAVAAVLAVLSSWRNNRKIKEVHSTFNSKMDLFLTETREAALAKGVLLGIAQARSELMQVQPPKEM